MSKSTPVLVSLCLLLGLGIFFTTRQLVQSSQLPASPLFPLTIKFGVDTSTPAPKNTLQASSALLWDSTDKKILFEQNAFERRPLASITKLMTAMVALDYGIPWDKEATILPQEYGVGGQLQLFSGEAVSMKDLVNASLLGSANNATFAYVRQLGIPSNQFIQAMNRKAVSLGLEQTEFYDVTGLDVRNVSNAYEIARIADEAFNKYPEISQITSQKEYAFTVHGTGREHVIRNTNKLISEQGEEAKGSKTGYLYESQYCLVMQGAGKTANRIAVVLGSEAENENFSDVDRLLHLEVTGQ